MCGKFTAMRSWREVHAFSQPLTAGTGAGSNDEVLTYRVANTLPVIVFDRDSRRRLIVPMTWGFPSRSNPHRPDPIHARSETIDQKQAFAEAFRDGQRGIVVMRTFNEGKEIVTPRGANKTEQWTIDPHDGIPRGFAFLWREFDVGGVPKRACVMATVAASALIEPITDRMPAILEDEDWSAWLGEESAEPEQVKAVLKTMEGVNWTMAPEPKKPKAPAKPVNAKNPDDEPGLL